jgi:hypothetical protein
MIKVVRPESECGVCMHCTSAVMGLGNVYRDSGLHDDYTAYRQRHWNDLYFQNHGDLKMHLI